MPAEVKPGDWNAEENRWEAEDSGGSSIVPTPEAADSGKVLTAGADGTASWQTASGGGGYLLVRASGECTYGANGWSVGVDVAPMDIVSAIRSYTPVYVAFPAFTYTSPYYSYDEGWRYFKMVEQLGEYFVKVEDPDDGTYAMSAGPSGFILTRMSK